MRSTRRIYLRMDAVQADIDTLTERHGSEARSIDPRPFEEMQALQEELAEALENSRERTLEEERRATFDQSVFWFRRFVTTLGIANAAAFAALASGLLQSDDPVKVADVAAPAMDRFIWGAISAGAIPLCLWARAWGVQRIEDYPDDETYGLIEVIGYFLAYLATMASVVMFCWGLFLTTGAVHGLAEGKKVADARVAAERKVHVHAAPPAVSAVK